ncbi:helix-turn-helix transcriptional regulator [Amaricoccus tamworthensis]|uniref:helix-turn-helix transcriptional regulator n=1 Tax=Amaricoccus tamworthensis TaxID=57002 RepID=UPI003C7A4E56
MTRSDANGRLHRLERLAVRLKQDGHCTISDLAREHGVSQRTVARDLALMREQGMPLDADRGRGGGVRLDRNWGVGRLNLDYSEAVDLLISIAVAEQMNSPIFLAGLGSVRRQLAASFSPEKRNRVNRLKSRILIGVTASTYVQADFTSPPPRVVRALHQAFMDQETLRIRYAREDGTASGREIEPHYLLLNYPVWYVLAHDHLRDQPRTFRCDRMLSASRTGTRFRLRPRDDFRSPLTEHDAWV